MKKLIYLVAPLMCFSTLISCGGSDPKPTPPIYVVDFNSNGASFIAPQKVKQGSLVKKPDDPIKEGFDFGGWYITNGGIPQEFDFNTPIDSDITLSCKWIQESVEFRFLGYGCTIQNKYDYRESLKKGHEVKYEVKPQAGFILPPETEIDCDNPYITYTREEATNTAELTVNVMDVSKEYRVAIRCSSQDYLFLGINMTNCSIEHTSTFVGLVKRGVEHEYSIDCETGYHLEEDSFSIVYPIGPDISEDIVYNKNGTITLTSDLEENVILQLDAKPSEPFIVNAVTFTCDDNTLAKFDDAVGQFTNFGYRNCVIGSEVKIFTKISGADTLIITKSSIHCMVDGVESDEFEFSDEGNDTYAITFTNNGFTSFAIKAISPVDTFISFSSVSAGIENYKFVVNNKEITADDPYFYFTIPTFIDYVLIRVNVYKTDETPITNVFSVQKLPNMDPLEFDYVPETSQSASIVIKCSTSVNLSVIEEE